ncbi:oxygen-independent coproporphyrinogen III oxidase [Roseibacterium sp. SDUM158016]|jgi:oxygen-independent coproporphyrinogen-3 oxidase|uniref:oxygen-independent coproporphyrinogen III oxidase n=1 Tax=Roseicyclus sediminis TaxID=2980997 RepID=UPI0021D350EC|nr:oxygen-independent coproporphyrinogen III oxidase [Roseibacterium sp. SDUM158016]MCU4654143.1 oxygen-independent coproporphyrinogen III oxidase [Roseibacterium sp. SDUM158016]
MEHLAQLRRLGLFDAKVPRYTSYPPATKFSNDVTGAVFRDWVSAIPEGSAISVYMHVPFCRRLCWFCACRTQGTRSDAPVNAYVDSLRQEVANLAAILPEGVRIARLHWGGGTPTLLRPEQMHSLADTILEAMPLARGAEFSVEIDPNEIDEARLDALAAIGMNRASIGVQDFDEDIQKTIGRIQGYEVTRETVEALRAHGIRSLNADILYGLPHQNQARMAESVQMLLSLSPDRVALYGYAHVPWMAKRQAMIPTDALPSPEERLHLFHTARRLFLWDGYQEIGIDHFARPSDSMAVAARSGHLRRNFQGYTDDTCDVLIGLGASAISRFPQGFAQNASGTAQYQASVREGQMATGRGHIFKGEDHWRGRMIEMLLCDFAIESAPLIAEYGVDELTLRRLYRSVDEAFPGMTRTTQNGFEITEEGRPLARMIARAFDGYEMRAEGHSAAF